MFTQYLLPALLLLAAACMAQYLPPYSTAKHIGMNIRPTHFRKETFFIPPGKCFRLIQVKEEYKLRCVWFGDRNADTTAHWLNATVWDQAPSPDIYFLNDEVIADTVLLISRSLPCAGRAVIKVDVGCDYDIEAEETNQYTRNTLHPAPAAAPYYAV